MSLLESTLANLAPGVGFSRDLPGAYNPRHGLAIYCLPEPGYSPSAPGVVLGEALAARSGLGCTLLEGIPKKIPEGAVVVGLYQAIRSSREDLLEDVPEPRDVGQYIIKLGRSALVTSPSPEGIAAGMQTLAMIVLRHNEDLLPGSLIVDGPLCQSRCLAIELKTGEIGINLLMQIASFAATFKANRLHLILDDDFDPSREIPGIETFVQTCHSYGMTIGVRFPWLESLLTGRYSTRRAWAAIRSAVRLFGASQAALDDPFPESAETDDVMRVAQSIVNGETGLKEFSVDARFLVRAGVNGSTAKSVGVTGWHRLTGDETAPDPAMADLPLRIDVEAPVPGLSARELPAFHRRLDAALAWLRQRPRRDFIVSFRDIGVSHVWQNLLYPAATGMIAAWGLPDQARQCAWLFANLLYGESALSVMTMWETVSAAFPPGLDRRTEALLRRTAFGEWPENEEAWAALAAIDWIETTRNIMRGAEALRNAAQSLTRNATTLTGAKLSLQTLSWLHCFATLTPELERRRATKFDDDGRTEPIANELYNNFQAWQAGLQELYGESGLEIAEMSQIESMGLRLKGLCEGIFE